MLRILSCGALALLCFAACNSKSDAREAKTDWSYKADSAQAAPISSGDADSSSDAIAGIVPEQWVRTADIKCRVGNVFETTTALERLVTRLNGVITESRIVNEPFDTKQQAVKNDSLKKIQLYMPTAHLTLRIPQEHLDSVVNTISQSAAFINYRTLSQTDVSLQYLSNSLKNQQDAHSPVNIEKGEKNKLGLLQYKDDRQQKDIDRKIENLQLSKNVRYATLTVSLFQPDVADISIQIDPQAITRIPFSEQLATALHSGLEVLQSILLVIIAIWPLWIISLLAWLGYRKIVTNRSPS